MKKEKKEKKLGRPYRLTRKEHIDLIKRKAAGESIVQLAYRYGVNVHTAYAYLKLEPEERIDR